jgi:hypothetical protein
MQTLGLSAAEWEAYVAALSSTHERRVVVEVQTLDGDVLRSLTPPILDGQVTTDVGAEPMHVLSLQLLDPSRSLAWEPDSPNAVPVHRSHALHVSYNVRVPALGRWVDCPVFQGPIWDMTREGAVVTLTAHSWDRQAMGEKWAAVAYGKKSKKTGAIRNLMAGVGETRMTVPDLRTTFPDRWVVKRLDKVWPKVRAVARSLGRNAFYDGDGRFWVRRPSSKPAMTFQGPWVLSEPKVERKVDAARNTFEVWGKKPKGKPRVRAVTVVPSRAPMSATGGASTGGLARHGKPHRLVHSEENPHIKTRREALTRAVHLRDAQARGESTVTVEVSPFPPLDPYDLVHVKTDEGTYAVRASQYSLPLGGSQSGGGEGAPMVIGTTRRTISAAPRRR